LATGFKDLTIMDSRLVVKVAMRRYTYFGILKTTFQDIARVLDVLPGQVYHCYPLKDLLTIAVMEQLLQKYYRQVVNAMDSSKSFRENLLDVLKARCSFLKAHYRIYLTLECSMERENYNRLEEVYNLVRNQILDHPKCDLLVNGNDNIVTRAALTAFISVLDEELFNSFRIFQCKLLLNQRQLNSIFEQQYKICEEFLSKMNQ
jgi:AcrR family transcriptional regulator